MEGKTLADFLREMQQLINNNPLLSVAVKIAINQIQKNKKNDNSMKTITNEYKDKLLSLYNSIKNSCIDTVPDPVKQQIFSKCNITQFEDLENKINNAQNAMDYENLYVCMENTLTELQTACKTVSAYSIASTSTGAPVASTHTVPVVVAAPPAPFSAAPAPARPPAPTARPPAPFSAAHTPVVAKDKNNVDLNINDFVKCFTSVGDKEFTIISIKNASTPLLGKILTIKDSNSHEMDILSKSCEKIVSLTPLTPAGPPVATALTTVVGDPLTPTGLPVAAIGHHVPPAVGGPPRPDMAKMLIEAQHKKYYLKCNVDNSNTNDVKQIMRTDGVADNIVDSFECAKKQLVAHDVVPAVHAVVPDVVPDVLPAPTDAAVVPAVLPAVLPTDAAVVPAALPNKIMQIYNTNKNKIELFDELYTIINKREPQNVSEFIDHWGKFIKTVIIDVEYPKMTLIDSYKFVELKHIVISKTMLITTILKNEDCSNKNYSYVFKMIVFLRLILAIITLNRKKNGQYTETNIKTIATKLVSDITITNIYDNIYNNMSTNNNEYFYKIDNISFTNFVDTNKKELASYDCVPPEPDDDDADSDGWQDGGSRPYQQKYLKYKSKYLQLKNKMR